MQEDTHATFTTLATLILLGSAFLSTAPGALAHDAEPCPNIEVDPELEDAYPTLKYRCIGPETFVTSASDVGIERQPDLDDLRPGINVGPCSTSFLLTDGQGGLYLTQSAHCVREESGSDLCDDTFMEIGDPVDIEGYQADGEVAYVSGLHMQEHGATDTECSDYDFAIIKLPQSLHDEAHPAIRHIGGPTGLVDALEMEYQDDILGYGNSDDRGFAVEFATGQDHSQTPVWGSTANRFEGYYVGSVLNEGFCLTVVFCEDNYDGDLGYINYLRYTPPKITGDSGSPELDADGQALGVTSVLNLATGLTGTMPLYDALLKIEVETGQHYELVTWPEADDPLVTTPRVPPSS